jgi:3-oxoacyl-[acyl-carrier protein] reductase
MTDLNLRGKTALICGASAGIGLASARLLAARGAKIIAVSRTEATLKEAVRSFEGGGHRFLALDLNQHDLLKTKIEAEIANSGGAIEIVLNNSTGPKAGATLDATLEDFAQAFHQQLLTSQLLAQLLVPGMKDRSFGRIINIVSTSVRVPIPNLGVSNTVRAAVASWAKTLSNELGPFGITVNSVLPGFTKTARLDSLLKNAAAQSGANQDDVAQQWKLTIPARRFAEPEEIAAAVGFLASDEASYINGIVLPVDGGRTPSL